MKIRLIYFNIPFWRAEVSRIALYIGDIPFEDVRIKGDDFSYIKENGKMKDGTIIPFRQLPVLEVDGHIIAQTAAIARFCGKLSSLYPNDNSILAGQVDQVIDTATDINLLLRPSMKEEDPIKKLHLRKELSNGDMPKYLNYLEQILMKNKSDQWFVGGKMTIADIAIWRLTGWLTSGIIDGLSKDLLKNSPLLTKLCDDVSNNSKVIKWVKKTYP